MAVPKANVKDDDKIQMLPDTPNDGKKMSNPFGKIWKKNKPNSPSSKSKSKSPKPIKPSTPSIPSNASPANSSTHSASKPAKALKSGSNSPNIFSKIGSMFKSKGSNDITSKANKEINRKMLEEQKQKQKSLSILLLGAGGSGKTTVFKQMEKLYNGEIEKKQMDIAHQDIRRNVLHDVYDLCKYNIQLNINSTTDDYKFSSSELTEICYRISSWNSSFIIDGTGSHLTPSLALDIELLWSDPAFKLTWNVRKNSHIMDNTPYFLDKIKAIADPTYKASFNHYVRVRDQTTGIICKSFLTDTEFGEYKFSVTDVGGQRAERRKWMKLFTDISVVVYIMSLSAYDQHLYEDNTKNCWDETLELFYKTSHQRVFDTTDWVIFFNKVDIFEQKIKNIPFTVYQPNFNELDKHNGDKVKEYIKDQFTHKFYDGLTKDRRKRKGSIYFHVTCATNDQSVGKIIQKVQVDLIKSQMKKMGYLM